MIRSSEKIQGIEIPDLKEKLKVTLFADDTIVYLSKMDKFNDLDRILQTWCTASTAKFNIEKTEVMPIGKKSFRDQMIGTKKITQDQDPIPEGVAIKQDDMMMRTLGGHISNSINRNDPWIKVIEKIKQALSLWKEVKLTLDGKIFVIQFELASRCQFTTAAQGMPDETLKILNKIMTEFIWDGGKPRVSRETLQ
ncbi:hypothetical protein GYMLUDRAFT_129501, partial [Collybiopsis luxurians FD-317 M1]